MDNREKYRRLGELRREEPVLWAILKNSTTTANIAKGLLMKPAEVAETLEEYRRDGDLHEPNGGHWLLNPGGPRYGELHELDIFATGLWLKLNEWARDQTSGLKPWTMDLTDKQATLYDLLKKTYGFEPFTTLEAAKAQGYTTAGFTKNQMTSLMKKGRVEEVTGRPRKWKILPPQ